MRRVPLTWRLVQILLRKVTDGFGRAAFDLGLDLGSLGAFVHEDAELAVVDEEATCRSIAILFEGHGLDGQIEDLPADKHANEAEQATRDRGDVLGSVLHSLQTKH